MKVYLVYDCGDAMIGDYHEGDAGMAYYPYLIASSEALAREWIAKQPSSVYDIKEITVDEEFELPWLGD